jgi:hypothetical protein
MYVLEQTDMAIPSDGAFAFDAVSLKSFSEKQIDEMKNGTVKLFFFIVIHSVDTWGTPSTWEGHQMWDVESETFVPIWFDLEAFVQEIDANQDTQSDE